jgi:hypothetical protein
MSGAAGAGGTGRLMTQNQKGRIARGPSRAILLTFFFSVGQE